MVTSVTLVAVAGCRSSNGALNGTPGQSPSVTGTTAVTALSTPPTATVSGGPSSSPPPAAESCTTSNLVVRLGPQPGLASQERAEIVAIRNAGSKPCAVSGYATVRLRDGRGRTLPFRYVHGGGPFVTKAPPAAVVLRSGATGYVLLAGIGCTVGVDGFATSATLQLPDWATSFATSLLLPGHGASLALCHHDPSPLANIIWVSPVEKSRQSLVG